MKAMIFAAGLGTRLRPLTDNMPKALVPVGGKTLLERAICKLRDAGYGPLVVNVHHFAGQIVDFVSSHDFGVQVLISDESSRLLDTGGGLLHARDYLEDDGEPFLVHNVDILSDLDLQQFRQACRQDALATLLVSERQTRRYLLFDDSMRLVGWTDTATGEVRSPYPDLDPAHCRRYAFAGIHNISPAIFGAFASYGFSGSFPIMDFYLRTCAELPVLGLPVPGLQILDVGKTASLQEAGKFI